MTKQPFTYKETAVYLVSDVTNYEPVRITGKWISGDYDFRNKVFQAGLKSYSEHYNIFATFEEAKLVALEIADQDIQKTRDFLEHQLKFRTSLFKRTKFSYQETEFFEVCEEAEMFPYINKIELIKGKWLTTMGTDPKSVENSPDELLVFHRNGEGGRGYNTRTQIPSTHLFHTFPEALAHVEKLIEERKEVIKKKIETLQNQVRDLQKLVVNCTDTKYKIRGHE